MMKKVKDKAWHKKQMDLPKMSNGANYLVFCRMLIISCGGGGRVGASVSHLFGSIVHSPVEGVEYATETQVGVTDANEALMYRSVETCAAAIMIILMG